MHPSFRHYKSRFRAFLSPALAVVILLAGILLAATLCTASEPQTNAVPNIFEPRSTPADSIRHLSFFVLSITGLIFLVVFSLLTYVIVKFRRKAGDRGSEPAQVYGSTQIELAWTVIPILIVAVLFAATARVIHAIQDAPKPPTAIEVTVIGHQFWWEFRYPGLGIVTANELHVPVSDPAHPTPRSQSVNQGNQQIVGRRVRGKRDLAYKQRRRPILRIATQADEHQPGSHDRQRDLRMVPDGARNRRPTLELLRAGCG